MPRIFCLDGPFAQQVVHVSEREIRAGQFLALDMSHISPAIDAELPQVTYTLSEVADGGVGGHRYWFAHVNDMNASILKPLFDAVEHHQQSAPVVRLRA